MRLSSRSKLSILLSAVTFVALIGAIVLTAVPRGPVTHAAGGPGSKVPATPATGGSGPTVGTATTGGSPTTAIASTATRSQSYSFKSLPPIAGPGPTDLQVHSSIVLFNRLGRSRTVPAETASSVPSGQGVSLANLPTDASLQNFNGASSLDSFNVNGVVLEPPDQGLCVGPLAFAGGQEVVFEPINLVLGVFKTSGTPLISPFSLNSLFIEPSDEFLSDPRCVFDPATRDFFFSITAIDSDLLHSHIDVTVLFQDTAGSFASYHFDTTDATNVAGGCPCLGDQPTLGIDQNNIYVSINEFSILGVNFNGSNVFAISKSQLATFVFPNVVRAVEFAHFFTDSGAPVLGLQPAISTGNAPVEYLVHSFAVDAAGFLSTGDQRLGVFAIANGQVVSNGGFPTILGPVVTQSEPYTQPQPASSTGGVVLNADDDRLQQVQYINGSLWAALSTGFSIAGALGISSCNQGVCDAAAWFQVAPVLLQGHLIAAEVLHQGYEAVNNASVLYPAIVQSPDGTVDMAFSVTSTTLNPSAAFATNVNRGGVLSQGPVFVAATGSGPDTGFTCSPCRWGDYSWATLDPNSNNIWMGSEYIVPQVAVQTIDDQNFTTNWGTRIYEIAA